MNTSKGIEKVNEEGAIEIKVDTVDYRAGPGREGTAEPEKENVEVTHLVHPDDEPGTGHFATEAAGELAQSAKQAISGSSTGKQGGDHDKAE